jgi:hypothetical protein
VVTEEAWAEKFALVRPHLDERQWRLLLGAEADAIGRAGSVWWPGSRGVPEDGAGRGA